MTSFFSRFRAVLVAFIAFCHPGLRDHDLNMQCKVKVKLVAIDTPDENGGLARTSFLYVEVEADQKIYVEPESCPEGYVPPMTVYQINYASAQITQALHVRSRGIPTYNMRTYLPTRLIMRISCKTPAKYSWYAHPTGTATAILKYKSSATFTLPTIDGLVAHPISPPYAPTTR